MASKVSGPTVPQDFIDLRCPRVQRELRRGKPLEDSRVEADCEFVACGHGLKCVQCRLSLDTPWKHEKDFEWLQQLKEYLADGSSL